MASNPIHLKTLLGDHPGTLALKKGERAGVVAQQGF